MVENRIKGMTTDGTQELITAQEVIKKRQYDCLEAALAMDGKIAEAEQTLVTMKREREMLRMEYEMWENYGDRNQVRVTHTSTTTVEMSGRKSVNDRMKFEDALKGIMRDAGRPIQFADIRSRLEKFGFVWNNYVSAHNYITRSGIIESAGKHGYYQPFHIK